jgi:hypothetical protein
MTDGLLCFQKLFPSYSSSLSLLAIKLFKFDDKKCKAFLSSFVSLREMGFPPSRIQSILLECQLDKEAALEKLLNE